MVSCPHARGGEPRRALANLRPQHVVPTPVGVNRHRLLAAVLVARCPHARGGEPPSACQPKAVVKLSPRPWG